MRCYWCALLLSVVEFIVFVVRCGWCYWICNERKVFLVSWIGSGHLISNLKSSSTGSLSKATTLTDKCPNNDPFAWSIYCLCRCFDWLHLPPNIYRKQLKISSITCHVYDNLSNQSNLNSWTPTHFYQGVTTCYQFFGICELEFFNNKRKINEETTLVWSLNFFRRIDSVDGE